MEIKKTESIAQLAEALSKAQGQIIGAKTDSENPFFKSHYADLASVWDAIRKPLADNKLSIVQLPMSDEGRLTLTTLLLHASGEWIASEVSMQPVKNDPQGIGSCMSYMRRYSLAAMVGVYQIDDDAEKATRLDGKSPITPPQAKQAETGGLSVKAVVEKTSTKKGNKGGKEWTLYGILAGGTWYNTFSQTLYDTAVLRTGKAVEIVYQKTEKGNNLIEIRVEGCTGSPSTCELSTYAEGEAYCDEETLCQFQSPQEETVKEAF